jgi:hypothetical protein
VRCSGSAELGNCPKYAEDIDFHHPLTNHVGPDPSGDWVSSQCEIIPKPKFIVRRLNIQGTQSSRWMSKIYHYEDSWCTKPTFFVKMFGTYSILPTTATPNSKASYGANFRINEVYINSDKVDFLEAAIDFVLQKCPGALPNIMEMTNKGKIDLDAYRNKDVSLDVDGLKRSKHCRYYFAVHPISYGKVRMTGESEGSQPATASGKHPRQMDKLYFAAIPPFHTSRDTSKGPSTKFQYALSRVDRPHCPICKGAALQPSEFPILKAPRRSKNFGGSWVTKSCIASDDTTFQSDFYTFSYQSRSTGTFEFHENIFSDADCKVKVMNYKSGGTFHNNGQAPGLRGVHRVNLKVTRFSMTIFSETTLSMVRNQNCGDPKKWRIGTEQNLTAYNGCPILGFVIPASFDTLIRVSKSKTSQQFYITDVDPNEKGVFFSSEFVSCESVTENFKARLTTTGRPKVTRRIPVVTNFKFDPEGPIGGEGSGSVGGCKLTLGCSLICILISIVYYL